MINYFSSHDAHINFNYFCYFEIYPNQVWSYTTAFPDYINDICEVSSKTCIIKPYICFRQNIYTMMKQIATHFNDL